MHAADVQRAACRGRAVGGPMVTGSANAVAATDRSFLEDLNVVYMDGVDAKKSMSVKVAI